MKKISFINYKNIRIRNRVLPISNGVNTKGGDARGDLLFVVAVVVGLGILWVATGGPEKAGSIRPFLQPPPPLGSGEQYGTPNGWSSFFGIGGSPDVQSEDTSSGTVSIESASGAYSDRVEDEYVVLRAGGAAVNISGWRLKSSITGKSATIGKGSELAYSAQVNPENPIVLRPGDRAIVSTIRSPIGVSFRTNLCTGYFGQFQNFTPSLQNTCPLPYDELERAGNINLSDACVDYVRSIPSCTMVLDAPPELSSSCQAFIESVFTYNSCVMRYKGGANFPGTEWRIFLGQNENLWKGRRETIELIDQNGKVVDTYSY